MRTLAGFGCESLCRGPLYLDSRMGTAQGIYPWVSTLVMGNLMGRRFWVGRGCFFLGVICYMSVICYVCYMSSSRDLLRKLW
jgi:hypothetical protein